MSTTLRDVLAEAESVVGAVDARRIVERASGHDGAELTLQLDFDTHVLGPGDSLQFDSVRPHLYSNRGSTPARGLWFVVGRRQHTQAMPAPAGAVSDTRPQVEGELTSAVDVLQAMDRLT